MYYKSSKPLVIKLPFFNNGYSLDDYFSKWTYDGSGYTFPDLALDQPLSSMFDYEGNSAYCNSIIDQSRNDDASAVNLAIQGPVNSLMEDGYFGFLPYMSTSTSPNGQHQQQFFSVIALFTKVLDAILRLYHGEEQSNLFICYRRNTNRLFISTTSQYGIPDVTVLMAFRGIDMTAFGDFLPLSGPSITGTVSNGTVSTSIGSTVTVFCDPADATISPLTASSAVSFYCYYPSFALFNVDIPSPQLISNIDVKTIKKFVTC